MLVKESNIAIIRNTLFVQSRSSSLDTLRNSDINYYKYITIRMRSNFETICSVIACANRDYLYIFRKYDDYGNKIKSSYEALYKHKYISEYATKEMGIRHYARK